ncbi:hypothetical protein DFH11DRAFT_1651645 [Phellopilus nigrolimitatus]|nr:hypothetical protein DFH11DRAFT_1651645 [Phellopilus nigrolimitatus]
MRSDAHFLYESVVARFEKRLGPNPKPQEVLNAADELSEDEIEILVANASKMADLTPAQEDAFTTGVAKTITSQDAVPHLETAAADAAAACNAIETMFTNLKRTLASIDAKNIPPKEGPFMPRFKVLNQKFRQIMRDSRDLAVRIAAYGRRFDMVIIPFCNDGSLTTAERKAKVVEFVKDADAFKKSSADMGDSFDGLKDDFSEFVDSFGSWAFNKEGADSKELKQARTELEGLKNKLHKLEHYLLAAGGVVSVSLLVAKMSGSFAQYATIGGLIIAGISVAVAAGLAIARTSQKKRVAVQQARVDSLDQSISDIKATRDKLEQLGGNYFYIFDKNISFLASIWDHARIDAVEIKEWLEKGEKESARPKYMKISVDETVSVYKTMAGYLYQYADGIGSAVPNPNAQLVKFKSL